MRQVQHLNPLTDTNQSWWELVAIQFAGWMGIPVLATSILILEQNSFLGAILTIIVGNAVMWFIRLGIISMSSKNRQSTLDISRIYLGSFGGYFISVLLLVSTFTWYVTQTTIGGNNLTQLLSIHENHQINQFVQMSVLLGIISAFLCMEGIVLLRKLSVFSFPILLISFFAIFFFLPSHPIHSKTQTISLSGLSLFLATNLGLSSDLPTFFRHGKSWIASIKALTVIQILNLVFGILGLYFGVLVLDNFELNESVLSSGDNILKYSLIVFIFFSVICSNVANVYSASVGWEIVAPKALVGRKEYLILGLSLTILFILTANLFSVDSLLTASDTALVNLCIILILGYILKTKLKEEPTLYLQLAYFCAWAFSTTINIIQLSYKQTFSPLATSLLSIFTILSIALITKRIFYRLK